MNLILYCSNIVLITIKKNYDIDNNNNIIIIIIIIITLSSLLLLHCIVVVVVMAKHSLSFCIIL